MSVLSPFLFALVVEVVTEFAREGTLSELLYADDLVLISETIKGLGIIKWKEAFENKGLKVNLMETKVMVSVASHRMTCLKVKLIYVLSAA